METGPPLEATLTREEGLAYFKEMTNIREMELAARDLYQKKIIRGFLHLFVGQVSIVDTYNACVHADVT